MKLQNKLDRREFLKVGAAGGTSLVIGWMLGGCSPDIELFPAEGSAFTPNAFLTLGADGRVTITIPRSEMGQGVHTALAMMVAEELDIPWEQVTVVQAPYGSQYGDQGTGGSSSVIESYAFLRRAGAYGKAVLMAAAAQTWGAAVEEISASRGEVIHEKSERRFAYGDLVEVAAELVNSPDVKLSLKQPEEFALIGTSVPGVDNLDFVTGRAVYGMDVRLPGMVTAAIIHCPVPGGRLVTYDPEKALALPGVLRVIEVDSGVAVIAKNTWAAFQGKKALEVEWDAGDYGDRNTETIDVQAFEQALASQKNAPDKLIATYKMPFLAHIPMEPINCSAHVTADFCEIWAPTQNPFEAYTTARRITGLPEEAVRVNVTMIGGGFGRRLNVDYVEQAVRISQAVGSPVQLVWTRAEDIQHDFYHPLSYNRAKANLSEAALPQVTNLRGAEPMAHVPTGAWRGASNITPAYVREAFIDEMAEVLGRDPFELRMEIEPENLHAVLEKAAQESGWGTPLPAGWGRGIACHATWNSTPVAEVVEVSVSSTGEITVHKVCCVIDPGLTINPDGVRAQMESGIIFGLTAALKGEITFKEGRVEQSNFSDYPMIRVDEAPQIDVHIMPTGEQPRGVGEMAVPPIIPAVLNAIYDATGVRVRHLPVRREDLV